MRSGYRIWLAVTAGVVLTGGCGSVSGAAEVTTLPPAPSPDVSTAPAPGRIAPTGAETPQPEETAAGEGSDVERPPGTGPVQVPPPKLSEHTYTFPVKGCKVSYARKLLVLPKTTIWTRPGCSFVSPVDGTVDEVRTTDSWSPSTDHGADREGRFVTVIGADGVRYLGGHLESVAAGIEPGKKVKAGQLLGTIGNSGNARATAANLYFAISWKADPGLWWVRRGMVKPWDYLDAWRNGNKTLSPREETLALRRKVGASPACTILCASKSVTQPKPSPTPTRKKPTQRPPDPQPTVLEPIDN
ncbi:hypothetical protein HNP84_002717 [Thermocatellispora tengchongensis]|uniref:M23ase beta-sheet core domain-containing protein n=1 Tax=Thermocatellispora tengchongensis TaxID=1073253 RepID=A0A840P3C0_9ACTN|nr:M23 family metallopeptidase [Thermocatellispora tengchongensis]MBB5132996.1 hypothetical protein [Thermocatellispora tengchongensis]